jgi:anti-anti-sigma regulatory factor
VQLEIVPDEMFQDGLRPNRVHTLVMDASGFTSIDCMGVGALKEVSQEMNGRNIKVYFASCKGIVIASAFIVYCS